MNNHFTMSFFGSTNIQELVNGIQHAIDHIQPQDGIYTGDNLFTYHRNLSFLEDGALMKAFDAHATTHQEQSL